MTNEHELCKTDGPMWLARLEDGLVKVLPNDKAKEFHREFLEAIPVGVNLEPIKWKFCAFLLKENIERVLSLEIDDELKEKVVCAIRQCLAVHESAIITGSDDNTAAEAAESAAWAAAESAESVALSFPWSITRTAAWAAESAAWAAYYLPVNSAVRKAAESAAYAAESADWSPWPAVRKAAWYAALSAAYERYAEKLLELLRESK